MFNFDNCQCDYTFIDDFVDNQQRELIRVGILPKNYIFELRKEFVPM